jgi:acetyl esterase
MAPIDRRLRMWAWMVRRQASIASRSEAEVIALQSRHAPDNAVSNRIFGTVAPGATTADRTIPGPGGDLPVRVYQPVRSNSGVRPLIVYFHGGGFVFGDLRLGDWLCSSAAVTVGAVVVSVDYRLAPRHRFPAAVDDCYAALVWAAENAAGLEAEGPMGVMGESAGANLSAVMCLLARDRGGPALGHQALLYPATDMSSPPAAASASALFIPLPEDHSRLPPALIQVGEHDPLRDDGARYAAALRAAGVPVRFTEYVGMPHGYLNFPGLCRSAPQALAELCAEQTAVLVEPVHEKERSR